MLVAKKTKVVEKELLGAKSQKVRRTTSVSESYGMCDSMPLVIRPSALSALGLSEAKG